MKSALLPLALSLSVAASFVLFTAYSAAETDGRPAVLGDLDCIVEPSRVVELGIGVPGVLAEADFDRGDTVAAGTVMARLESSMEELAYAMARQVAANDSALELRSAAAAFGIRTRERNASLAEASAVSEQTLDQLETESRIAALQLQQEQENRLLAELERERTRAELLRRRAVSPFDAVVTERYRHVGEYIDGDPVYQIVQLDPLHVEVIVPVEFRDSLHGGMGASVHLAAPGYEGRPLRATVDRIDPISDAASATFGLRLVLPNPQQTIPGGVRCTLDFHSKS